MDVAYTETDLRQLPKVMLDHLILDSIKLGNLRRGDSGILPSPPGSLLCNDTLLVPLLELRERTELNPSCQDARGMVEVCFDWSVMPDLTLFCRDRLSAKHETYCIGRGTLFASETSAIPLIEFLNMLQGL